MSDQVEDRPNKYPLPPLLTVAVILLCLLLDFLVPIGWEAQEWPAVMRLTGWIVVFAAIAIDVWAFAIFRKHDANMMPHKAATDLLMSGPFAFSRNPIYLANVMLTLGIGLILGSRWFLLGAALLFLLLQEFAIKREEQHMAAKFGALWNDYTKSVRRWL